MESIIKNLGRPPAPRGLDNDSQSAHDITNRPLPKCIRILTALVDGETLNRWEAAARWRDSCLNSTIAEIQTRLGITINRTDEVVPGFAGIPTHCKRYSIAPESV